MIHRIQFHSPGAPIEFFFSKWVLYVFPRKNGGFRFWGRRKPGKHLVFFGLGFLLCIALKVPQED